MNERLRGVLVFVSGSGGTGRSTLALSVAAETVRLGGRALLVDLDPSKGLSYLTGTAVDGRRSRVREALAAPDALFSFVKETDYPGLFVLPGGTTVREALAPDGAQRENLARLLDVARRGFETVVLDVPAGTSAWVRAAVALAQVVVSCVVPEPLPVRCLAPLVETVAQIVDGRDAPAFGGICLNRVADDAPFLDEIVAELMRSFPGLMLDTAVPADPWFIEASARALPLPLLMPEAAGSRAISRMVAELQTRISTNGW